jgi:Fe2+ transport system protein FeoA
MVMLNNLQTNELARIVDIKCKNDLKQKLAFYGIFEGCFVRVIYAHGCITAKINTKLFNISKELAEKIRVIKLLGE